MEKLPPELLCAVFGYLKKADLLSCEQVNASWRHLIRGTDVLRDCVETEYTISHSMHESYSGMIAYKIRKPKLVVSKTLFFSMSDGLLWISEGHPEGFISDTIVPFSFKDYHAFLEQNGVLIFNFSPEEYFCKGNGIFIIGSPTTEISIPWSAHLCDFLWRLGDQLAEMNNLLIELDRDDWMG